jgi:uncharacterized cupredoxin-like copper-binding protein
MRPRRLEVTLLAALVAALLAGCEGGMTAAPERATAVTQAQRDAALRDADWATAADTTITIRDYGYLPRELRLRAGQPYRLTLVNQGSVPHYFTAPEFLGTVATRKVEVRNQAEVKAPVFTSFEVHPRGGSLAVYLIPLRAGKYRAYCHMKDHLAMGVEGVLIVE